MTYPNQFPGEWLTVDRGAYEARVSVELLEEAIQSGAVPVYMAAGARIVKRSEVQAWVQMFKASLRECAGCGE